VLYRCVQEHLETWLAQCRDGHHDDGPVPPPRIHRHCTFGVLAPNSPLRAAVTALALAATASPTTPNPELAAEPAHRRAARYAWALLLARIYEVFPLVCPTCGDAMRIIAFITDAPTVRDILVRLGELRPHPASRLPAVRHGGRRPAPITSLPPIRRYCPPQPSSYAQPLHLLAGSVASPVIT